VAPISTATNQTGNPVNVVGAPSQVLAITP